MRLSDIRFRNRSLLHVYCIYVPTYNSQVPGTVQIYLYHIIFFQICHSKYGEINPTKIAKLVNGYVRKFQHIKKKQKRNSGRGDTSF